MSNQEPTLRLFAVTYFASAHLTNGQIKTVVSTNIVSVKVIQGTPPDEQTRFIKEGAYSDCKKLFPENEGYQDHNYELVELPETFEHAGQKYRVTIEPIEE